MTPNDPLYEIATGIIAGAFIVTLLLVSAGARRFLEAVRWSRAMRRVGLPIEPAPVTRVRCGRCSQWDDPAAVVWSDKHGFVHRVCPRVVVPIDARVIAELAETRRTAPPASSVYGVGDGQGRWGCAPHVPGGGARRMPPAPRRAKDRPRPAVTPSSHSRCGITITST